MKRFSFLALLFIAAFSALACSGGSTHSPLLPNLTNGAQSSLNGSSKAMWGVWEIDIDTTTWEVTAIPLRGTQYTVDVVTFLQKPVGSASNLAITIKDITQWLTDGLIQVDVGLKHPFPGLDEYTGFDVLGVFVTPGSVQGNYDTDVVYTNGVDEPILNNPDGYTRWMNPVEFPANGTILRFVPGKAGTPDIAPFNSTINAYKYFADGLEASQSASDFFAQPDNVANRGFFKPGSFNHRDYQLKFPMVGGSPKLIFQYAVVASWVEPDKALSGAPDVLDIPGDFPLSANANEAILASVVSDESTLFFNDGTGGGDIKLGLEVFDWGAFQSSTNVSDQVFQIVVEGDSSVIPGGQVVFDQTALKATAAPGSSEISSVFQVEITGCTPSNNNPLPILVTVENTDPASFDPGTGTPGNDDRLAGYFRIEVPVAGAPLSQIQVIDPNGGETLWMAMSHEIKWDIGPGGVSDVKIEWSTDNFVSDIQTIIASTPNDGSYIWKPIPLVATTTARIRITDAVGTESDTSNGDFTIALPVWLEFQPKVIFNNSTVSWGWSFPFNANDNYISPAIFQTTTGTSYIGFYGINGGDSLSQDCMARATNGSSWYGSGGMWSTSGTDSGRMDNCKVAPSQSGSGWMSTSLWGYGWWTSISRGNGGPDWYCFNGPTFAYNTPKYPEIATDAAGYIWYFGDSNSAGINMVKSLQPGLTSQGGSGQVTGVTPLVGNGIISKTRSWTRMGQGLALIYYTTSGSVMLAKTTDAPTNDTWDTTEVVWSIGSDYTACNTPTITTDSTGRLFAAWAAHASTGDWVVLASMRDLAGVWSTPAVVSSSATQLTDIAISSARVLLPSTTTEDVALVSWNNGDNTESALSPLDLMAFLPLQQVNTAGDVAQMQDSMCMNQTAGYLYDVLFAYTTVDTKQRVAAEHADFKTP
jgi:hypothetical protein